MTESRRFAVFEAFNLVRKEILVGVTNLPIPELADGRMDRLPIDVKHWEPTDVLSFRRLAENMPLADAWQFLELYAFYIEKGDWRIIRQKPRSGERR